MSGAFRAGAAYDLHTVYMSPFLFAAYATGAAYAAGCRGPPATLLCCRLALSPPLNDRTCFTNALILQHLCSSLFWRVDNETTRTFTGGEGKWSDQPVAYCPARPPELIHLLTIHCTSTHPRMAFRLPTPFSPYFSFALPHTSRPGLSTETFYPSVYSPPTQVFSLSSNSLDDISRSTLFVPPLLDRLYLHPYTLRL